MLPGGLPASTCATMRRAAAWPTRNAPLRFTRSTRSKSASASVEEIGAVNDAGIVDQDVEAAERAAGFRDHVLGRPRIADVGGDEAGMAEAARGGLAGGGIDVGDGDARAFGDVAPGNRVARCRAPRR